MKKCKEKERVHFYRLTIIDVDVMNVTINKKNGDEKYEGEFVLVVVREAKKQTTQRSQSSYYMSFRIAFF